MGKLPALAAVLTAVAFGCGSIATAHAEIITPPECYEATTMSGATGKKTVSVPETCYPTGTEIQVGEDLLEVPADLEAAHLTWMNEEGSSESPGGHAWLERPEGDQLVLGLDDGSPDPNTLTAAAVGNECSDSYYKLYGFRMDPITYRVNTYYRPTGVSSADWLAEINLAASTWKNGTNACGYATGGFSAAFIKGSDTSSLRAMTSAGGCFRDGYNVIDFGAMPADKPNRIGQACMWTSWFGGWRVYEYNIRLKHAPMWFRYKPASCSGKYELAGLMTHEFGHTLGFADLDESAHRYLTMSSVATPCSYDDRILGRGDYLALQRLYG